MALNPFGEVSCELEKRKLGGRYSEFFFSEAPFNEPALRQETYLIIGRRGSGKTSLGEYFTFQDRIPGATCIDVNEPGVYNAILNRVIRELVHPSELAIPLIKDLWEYTFWLLAAQHLRGKGDRVGARSIAEGRPGTPSTMLRTILTGILEKYVVGEQADMSGQIATFAGGEALRKARDRVLASSRENPVIIAVDSMEHYSVADDYTMWATAALVECASDFNAAYASEGVHVKVFLTDEVFPYLQENVITNVSKHVRDPLFLHWRPRDLARLVCWRLHKYLSPPERHDAGIADDVNWGRYADVIEKVWAPLMGRELVTQRGVREHSFSYVLRHTQMRPRQLVMICNRIAKEAEAKGTFPKVGRATLAAAVREQELQLANEVVSSYSRIWPHAGQIVSALSGMPSRFEGRELDRAAKRTAAEWPPGEFSRTRFKRLVTELGIVGRQRRAPSGTPGIVEADFEFLLEDRLYLTERDVCVIHPMFYRKLNIQGEEGIAVYPFPDHPEFRELHAEG